MDFFTDVVALAFGCVLGAFYLSRRRFSLGFAFCVTALGGMFATQRKWNQ